MRKNMGTPCSILLFTLVTLAFGISSCGESGPVKVAEITIAADNEGSVGDPTERLKPSNNPFHAVIRLNQSGKGTTVKMDFIAVETSEGNNITVLTENRTLGGINNEVDFTISLPRPWPNGTYRIDTYLNDSLSASKEFQIKE